LSVFHATRTQGVSARIYYYLLHENVHFWR
jgi:hypothetical protein